MHSQSAKSSPYSPASIQQAFRSREAQILTYYSSPSSYFNADRTPTILTSPPPPPRLSLLMQCGMEQETLKIEGREPSSYKLRESCLSELI